MGRPITLPVLVPRRRERTLTGRYCHARTQSLDHPTRLSPPAEALIPGAVGNIGRVRSSASTICSPHRHTDDPMPCPAGSRPRCSARPLVVTRPGSRRAVHVRRQYCRSREGTTIQMRLMVLRSAQSAGPLSACSSDLGRLVSNVRVTLSTPLGISDLLTRSWLVHLQFPST